MDKANLAKPSRSTAVNKIPILPSLGLDTLPKSSMSVVLVCCEKISMKEMKEQGNWLWASGGDADCTYIQANDGMTTPFESALDSCLPLVLRLAVVGSLPKAVLLGVAAALTHQRHAPSNEADSVDANASYCPLPTPKDGCLNKEARRTCKLHTSTKRTP
ncbi:hypothetical protein J3F83DRAFT_199943 [Trichoderma novae-zelandiae]